MYPTSQAEHPEIQLFKSWIRFIINFPIIIPHKKQKDYHHLPSMFIQLLSNLFMGCQCWIWWSGMGPSPAAISGQGRLHRASLANAVGALDGLKSLTAPSGVLSPVMKFLTVISYNVKMMVKQYQISWGIYIYDYICMYVCMYVCMSVCLSVCLSVCMYVCMYVCRIMLNHVE